MSLIRFSPMWDPFSEMDEVMNRLPATVGQNSMQAFVPAVNVYETKESVVVESALAGIDPNNVEVSVENGVLSISGDTKKEHEVEEKNYYRKEVRSGSFRRQIPLPTAVDEEKVEAVFEDGMLKITCPKVVAIEPKKISVKVIKNDKK
jgi:HSP20 family protein